MSGALHYRSANRAEIGRFVGLLFRYADADTFASLRGFDQTDRSVPAAILQDVKINGDLAELVRKAEKAAEKAANGPRPIVFAPPICTFINPNRARGEDLANGLTLSVELDEGDTQAARRRLEGLIGVATAIVASGGEWTDPDSGEVHPRLHLHWRLSEPTRTAEDHAKLRLARDLACRIVGADPTGKPVVHPLRWPGSWNLKANPVLARLVHDNDAAEIHLTEALDALSDAAELAGLAEADLPRSGTPTAPAPLLRSAMAAIPNPGTEVHYDQWIRLGYAAYRAFGGSEEGSETWDAWSRKSDKYDPAEQEAAWKRIRHAIEGSSPPRVIGAGTIFFYAMRSGWRRPESEPPATPDDPGYFASQDAGADQPADGRSNASDQDDPDAPSLRDLLSIEAWTTRHIPPADRLLGDLVTTTTRMFLVGRTGLGKTLLAFALGTGMASGTGFLHWRAARPVRVLIIDGEMPGELIKARSIDALRRNASAPQPGFLTIYSRDMEEEIGRLFPTLGTLAPLNSEAGRNFVLALIEALGGVDVVIFDNVMSLITGDQKDEIPWSETLPLVASLTARRVGQIWLDHTGHNIDRQYGTATKAWRFDAVGLMTPLPAEKLEQGAVGFTLSFEPPGKARRRTPNNWADFETCSIRLHQDQWTSDRSEAVQTKPKESRLKDRPAVMLREARRLIGAEGSRVQPAPNASPVRAVSRQVLRKALILSGWFPEHLLRTASQSEPELTRAAYTTENHALTTLKRNGFLAFNRDLVWLP